jgi:signal transduction histidine kinase
LSPSILDDLGLLAAIRWLIDDSTKYYNIKTSLDIEDINNMFSREAQIIIYRIFQESLTNIGKHAQATCVSVVIKKQGGRVSFVVKDDGKGFDVEQVLGRDSTERGLGLAAMDERARMLGGFFYIRSQEGKGTEITFTIPVDKGGNR